MTGEFPPRAPGRLYLTEGGMETEIMYKWGHELPHFAMFTLLDDPDAVEDMKGIWRRYLDVAAQHGMVPLTQGVDYRASPDWGALLGYSPEGLAEMQHRAMDFLKGVVAEYADRIPAAYIVGSVGPRGDAYSLNRPITEDEAEDYHSVQLGTLRAAGADMAWAMTFNNIPEAIGVTRAAAAIGIPLAVSLSLDSSSRLNSGPSLRDAIETIDAEAGDTIAFFSVNCSHPIEFEPALDGGDWQHKIRCVRPNAAKMDKIALCKIGHLEDGEPVELGEQMADVARRHPSMDIFGGCCGTDERHLDEMAKSVRAVRESVPPE
jgi:S-methylmethionine-dependent homocysteine/selenocysteine methylase